MHSKKHIQNIHPKEYIQDISKIHILKRGQDQRSHVNCDCEEKERKGVNNWTDLDVTSVIFLFV